MKKLFQYSLWIIVFAVSITSLECRNGRLKVTARNTVQKTSLLEQVQAHVKQSVTHDIISLRKIFDNKRKGFKTSASHYITIDYEHILGMDVVCSGPTLFKINGFHHDLNNYVEKSGVFSFKIKTRKKNGVLQADIFYQGKYIATKTFFPSFWSRKKVIQKIYEAYADFIKRGAQATVQQSGNYMVDGVTRDGIVIRMYISKQGLIKTAFPLL